MFGLVVRFDLRPDAADGFDRLVAETAPLIATSEPGTLIYATQVVEGEPGARIFYELYRDRAAFDEHERQEHVRRFLAAREEFLAGPPRVEFLTGVGGKGLPGGAL
ncbi:putative quinol monooxygenase [Candidatus Frankia nodulisporulans]|uniref:putative quinol monooxygenase n=1 Tax=Candidatus Frankia nodulisporulans TaxID=2060052 RepID=UPI0013D4BF12|nr:putative quinol monooxygenase [Candidatus Frankia nodulisporulans]